MKVSTNKLPPFGSRDCLFFETKRITYRNEATKYSIVEGLIKNKVLGKKNKTTFLGVFSSIFIEDDFRVEGVWINDSTYGRQFKIDKCEKIYPQTKKGIQEFIKRSVKGIGIKIAKAIVDKLGEDTLSLIEKDYKCLLDIEGMNEKKALKVYDIINENKRFEKLSIFVQNNGLGYKVTMQLYETFKDTAIVKIKENPYCLSNIEKLGFSVADTFSKNLGFSFNSFERVKHAILHFIEVDMQRKGNIFTYKDYMYEHLNTFLLFRGVYKDRTKIITKDLIDEGLNTLIMEGQVVVEEKDERECLYLKKFHYIEEKIVEDLINIMRVPRPQICTEEDIDEFIKWFESDTSTNLANRQKEALYMALTESIGILTGGPGTGKTHTINAIINCIKRMNPNAIIELAAPTGRAAKRMTELTGKNAKTIHRLIKLGFSENTRKNRDEEIKADFVIIDESSMIDAYVFYRLIQSIGINTRILFVGDYDQLPSVGPGLILRDLINSKTIKTVKLDEIFRQSAESTIVSNAHKVINGIKTKTVQENGLEFNNIKKNDFYFCREKDMPRMKKILISKIHGLINKMGATLEDIQVLLPMNVGDIGTVEINSIIQDEFNPKNEDKNNVKGCEMDFGEGKILRVGDRVMQLSNNYELEVFNGDSGYITRFQYTESFEIVVDYDGREVVYSEEFFDELELAYAITIHKSQGSEFPIVFMLIHEMQLTSNMINRNILYTGITRAKKMVVIVGSEEALNEGIKRVDLDRNSKIKDKLIEKNDSLAA